MKKIAIFASGHGTNAQNIIEYFRNRDDIKVELVLSNRESAFVLERARKLGVACRFFSRYEFYESTVILDLLISRQVDFIILAGFLWLVPTYLIKAFQNRIINIHPALLPAHGGKGMYGEKVHQAVIASGEKESGITIHFVNEIYDEGKTIFQAHCPVDRTDTPETLAAKVHELEYLYFPQVIEREVLGFDTRSPD